MAALAERLRQEICPRDPSVNPHVLTVAAYLHDLCNGQEEHEEKGAALVPSLIGHLCTPEETEAVAALIRVHDTRAPGTDHGYPPAVLLLQDADMLDHLGTYDIWITFSEFVHVHKTPMDYAVQFENGAFDRFAARWRAKINYPFSLSVYDEKIAYEVAFARRMLRELRGEFC